MVWGDLMVGKGVATIVVCRKGSGSSIVILFGQPGMSVKRFRSVEQGWGLASDFGLSNRVHGVESNYSLLKVVVG